MSEAPPVLPQDHVSRFKLLLQCIPIAVGLAAVKYGLDVWLGSGGPWGWLEFNSDLNVIFTAVVFIMGFVLGGTLTDFKEAERLPGEIASQLEVLEDWMTECVKQQHAFGTGDKDSDGKPRLVEREVLDVVRQTTAALITWFKSPDKRSESAFHAVKLIDAQIKELAGYKSLKGITVRTYGDLSALRKAVSRCYTIARTDFLGSAYTLFETFIVSLFLLLLACKFKSTVTATVVTGFMSLTYWYLYRLIRDVDNPFGYGEGHNEVSLHLLERYHGRLEARIAALGGSLS